VTERDERNIRGEAEIFDGRGERVATFNSHFKVKRKEFSIDN
jgi:hypothetical protein